MDKNKQHKVMAWLSPSFPIGAFSYSHGLEYAIQNGDITCANSLRNWMVDILHYGAGRNDAILLAQAYNAANPDRLAEIVDLAIALSALAERKLETTAQGAAFCKVVTAVYDADIPSMPLPVAIGVMAAKERVDLDEVLPLYIHSFAANIIAAAVRFVPLGQTEGQQVLLDLFDHFDDVATDAMTADLDDLGGICFLGDIASMKHETMATRIFRT